MTSPWVINVIGMSWNFRFEISVVRDASYTWKQKRMALMLLKDFPE